jgi:hypothetical protein
MCIVMAADTALNSQPAASPDVGCNFMKHFTNSMIEVLDASLADNNYSSVVQFFINDELVKIRFGILLIDFGHIMRILAFRPFENTGVAPYRYFFVLSYSKEDLGLAEIAVRVEQLDKHKQFRFKISQKYISNLEWFRQLNSKAEISQLII